MTALDLAMHRPLPDAFLRLWQVCGLTGYSKASVYRGMAAKTFPQNVRLSARVAVWLETEVREWMAREVARCRGAA